MHDMTLDDIDILHVKRIKIIICSGSYKYKYTSSYHCVMLRDFKMSYIYVNSYIDLNYVKIVKFKITTLLHFFNNYMILTKKCLKLYKKYDHEIINEFKYIILTREWS
jgi:hypothetical protein